MRFGAIIQTLVLATAVVFQLSGPNSSSAGDIDMVSREIYYSGGSVWVDDRLTVRASFAWRDAPVDQVFNEAREGKTNLLGDIQTIVKGEDLDVQRYTVETQKDFVDIHIFSKVKFRDTQKPAKLRWVSSLGGQNFTFPEGSIGRTKEGMEMLVFNGNGSPALWFPYLGAPRDEILADIGQHKEMWEFLNSGAAVRYVCRIKSGNLQETLFDWDQTTMPSKAPDGPSLLSMNSQRKLSLNDLYRLCTNFKVAKSGYYPIRVENKSTVEGVRAE